jgi:general secretion pathway protein A
MYETFYNLKERPFDLTPDPRFIYFTERHCEALANLVYGVRQRKGFLALSGEAGTGKTTLVNALLDTLERAGVLSAFVFNPLLSKKEFFKYLLADLNLKCDVPDKSEALMRLNALLLERYKQRQVTVLIIDEAHNLSAEILEEVRLLTNFETTSEKLLQIVLVGQPELDQKLNSPNLRQLRQRINIRCSLAPLTFSETGEYVRTRMEIAGLPNQQVFSQSCIDEIFRYSGGVPRVINTICDNAMLIGFASDSKTISPEIIHEVVRDLGLSNGRRLQSRTQPSSAKPPHATSEPAPDKSNAAKIDDFGESLCASHAAQQGPMTPKNKTGNSSNGQGDSESMALFMQFVGTLRDRANQTKKA